MHTRIGCARLQHRPRMMLLPDAGLTLPKRSRTVPYPSALRSWYVCDSLPMVPAFLLCREPPMVAVTYDVAQRCSGQDGQLCKSVLPPPGPDAWAQEGLLVGSSRAGLFGSGIAKL